MSENTQDGLRQGLHPFLDTQASVRGSCLVPRAEVNSCKYSEFGGRVQVCRAIKVEMLNKGAIPHRVEVGKSGLPASKHRETVTSTGAKVLRFS